MFIPAESKTASSRDAVFLPEGIVVGLAVDSTGHHVTY